MPGTYITASGDALDLICQREYGAQAGAVELVLEANPHIKTTAHRLPIGVVISLPDLVVRGQEGQSPKLWD